MLTNTLHQVGLLGALMMLGPKGGGIPIGIIRSGHGIAMLGGMASTAHTTCKPASKHKIQNPSEQRDDMMMRQR